MQKHPSRAIKNYNNTIVIQRTALSLVTVVFFIASSTVYVNSAVAAEPLTEECTMALIKANLKAPLNAGALNSFDENEDMIAGSFSTEYPSINLNKLPCKNQPYQKWNSIELAEYLSASGARLNTPEVKAAFSELDKKHLDSINKIKRKLSYYLDAKYSDSPKKSIDIHYHKKKLKKIKKKLKALKRKSKRDTGLHSKKKYSVKIKQVKRAYLKQVKKVKRVRRKVKSVSSKIDHLDKKLNNYDEIYSRVIVPLVKPGVEGTRENYISEFIGYIAVVQLDAILLADVYQEITKDPVRASNWTKLVFRVPRGHAMPLSG